jgi:hypothetical protein
MRLVFKQFGRNVRQFALDRAVIIMLTAFSLCLLSGSYASSIRSEADLRMSRYNVIWNSPSKDASGVMPLGNGDIAAGVYAIENGDLYLLLAKNDAYTYMGDIFKTGRVRVSLDPNPFTAGKPFLQTLDLASGSVQIEADGVKLRIWADAARPVYHIEVNSPRKIAVTAQPDLWNRFDHCSFNVIGNYADSVLNPPSGVTQDVPLERNGNILWYYAVGDRSIYPDDLNHYDIEHMAPQFPDPFRFYTFGNLLECPDMNLKDGTLAGEGKNFDIRIHALTMQTPQPEEWIETISKQATEPVDTRNAWKEHLSWWEVFWNRSWIDATDTTVPVAEQGKLNGEASAEGTREETDGAAIVAQSYNVFRFLMACQGRGRVQVKFNGGLFTQQLKLKDVENDRFKGLRSGGLMQKDDIFLTHEDDRLWGRRFTYQNQRLLYWPLLSSGDFEMLQPFFNYYSDLLPMRKAVTKAWFGHDGAYYRENIEPTGAERDNGLDGRPPKRNPGEPQKHVHDYHFNSGLETLAMMLDYVNYSGDGSFRDNVLVPFAREVLLFFDQHYARGADGKLRLDPASVLESWWLAVNPSPDVAGLQFCLDELLAMKAGTPDDMQYWQRFRSEIPEVPLQTIEGKTAIAPAETWDMQRNAENGEIYPIFPFRCFGLGLGTGDIAEWTMRNRTQKNAFNYACWTQDQIGWAYAGNAAEAAEGLVHRFRNASTMCRFPLYGKEWPDSCPDWDHFGSGSVALQRMLIQEANGKILLLPAWPAKWDVDFKQHVTGGAVITGRVNNGKLVEWDIVPADRKSDVVVFEPQGTL